MGLTEHKIVEYVPGKPILILTWPGSDPSLPSILLNSHYGNSSCFCFPYLKMLCLLMKQCGSIPHLKHTETTIQEIFMPGAHRVSTLSSQLIVTRHEVCMHAIFGGCWQVESRCCQR